jgi:hypothetical protein
MSVCVSSVFVLSRVGSDLTTGLITRQMSPTNYLHINSDGKQARGPDTKGRRRRNVPNSVIAVLLPTLALIFFCGRYR